MARAGIGRSLEGVHAVAAALRAGRVTALTIESGRAATAALAPLIELAEEAGVTIEYVDDVSAYASTSAPQGVVAAARALKPLSLAELVSEMPTPAVMVLDRVEDPRNVGAVARSTLAAGFDGLVVAERRAAPLSGTAFKAAAGALEDLGIAVVSSVADAVGALRDLGLWTIGLDENAERPLFGLDLLAEPVAMVLGAEGKGLSRLVRRRVDLIAAIPTEPSMPSLNVAAAATLAAYEVWRARRGIT